MAFDRTEAFHVSIEEMLDELNPRGSQHAVEGMVRGRALQSEAVFKVVESGARCRSNVDETWMMALQDVHAVAAYPSRS
jgi:hypothetical protein